MEWRPHLFFSTPQPTIAACQALHEYEFFDPAAIFETNTGYVYGRIREMDSPPHQTAQAVQKAVGYKLTAYHGPLINVWRSYPDDTPIPENE